MCASDSNYKAIGSKGWRSGESARLPPMLPGFKSRLDAIWGLSLFLVLSFAPRGFPPVLRFSPLHKNQRFQIPILPESGRRRTTLWMCYLQIIIYLFISLQGMTRTVLPNCPISVEIRTVDSQSDLRILLWL